MYPMSFSEFLLADNCENLYDYMKDVIKNRKNTRYIFNMLEEN